MSRYVVEASTASRELFEVIDTEAHPRRLLCRARQADALLIAEALNHHWWVERFIKPVLDPRPLNKRITP